MVNIYKFKKAPKVKCLHRTIKSSYVFDSMNINELQLTQHTSVGVSRFP